MGLYRTTCKNENIWIFLFIFFSSFSSIFSGKNFSICPSSWCVWLYESVPSSFDALELLLLQYILNIHTHHFSTSSSSLLNEKIFHLKWFQLMWHLIEFGVRTPSLYQTRKYVWEYVGVCVVVYRFSPLRISYFVAYLITQRIPPRYERDRERALMWRVTTMMREREWSWDT